MLMMPLEWHSLNKMINFTKAKFIKSAQTYSQKPEKNLKEIVFIGKSNVGKSSLINALVKNKGLAKTSSKPGYTKLLNYFEIDEKFYLTSATLSASSTFFM